MRVQLIVSDDCDPCRAAESIWGEACDQLGETLEIVDLASPGGAAIAASLELRSLPAALVDGRLVAVGVQDPNQVAALLRSGAAQTDGSPSSD